MIKTTLGLVADIITGPFGSSLHQYEYVSFGIPVIMPQDIGNRNLSYEKIAYITQEKANELSRYLVDTNDIVYARRGDIEKHAFITDNDKGAICGTGCLRVRIIDKTVNPIFLSFYLNKPETKKWISLHAVGSNMPNINTEILSKVPIVLPDKKEQDSIASFLDSIDNKISNNNDICSDLEGMAKLLYNYWFVQFDFPDENGKPYKSSGGKMVWNEELKREIPDGWEIDSIGNHISVKRGVSYSSNDIVGNGIPMLNLNSFNTDVTYKESGIKTYSGNYSNDKIVSPYDLIMCATQQTDIDISGKTNVIGKALFVPDIFESQIITSMDVITLMCDDTFNKYYLRATINAPFFHKYIVGFANGTKIKHLDVSGLLNMQHEIPPNGIMSKYSSVIELFEKEKSKIIRENQELASLRDFLLPMLMNGQVKVKKGESQ